MAGVMEIVLERDGHDQPWGFRLQGGVDVAMPLSVQRVLVGTPADGTLHKGDIITRISYTETKNITHQQAADLFNNAGNQITVQIKRAGVHNTPAASASSSAPLVNGSTVPGPTPVPVSGGVPLPGITSNTTARSEHPAVRLLPKSQFALKKAEVLLRQQKQPPVNMETLSIQSQPYRTLPLLQPSAKVRSDLGVGSISHLKMQDDHISGVRESQYVPQSYLTAKAKHDDLIMKQKVTGTLQHIQQTQTSPSTQQQQFQPAPGFVNKQYNSPIGLYSQENVQEVMRMQAEGRAPGQTVHPSSPKPVPVVLAPSKEYNPQTSATWRALQETDAPVDPVKIANYSSLKEHDPIYSEVYTAPIAPKPGQRPPPRTNALPGPRSPVSEFLPPSMRPAGEHNQMDHIASVLSPTKPGGVSPVLSATLAENKPINHHHVPADDKIPMYETNAIGGRRKIAQTASFNKLMMDVLGE